MSERSHSSNYAPSSEDLARDYEAQLRQATHEHETTAEAISDEYRKEIDYLASMPASSPTRFEAALETPATKITPLVQGTYETVDKIITEFSDRFVDSLDANGILHWSAVIQEADKWRYPGDHDDYVLDRLRAIPDHGTRATILKALDGRVWQKVQAEADKWRYPGDYDNYIHDAIGAASSKTVQAAMLAALDARVSEKVQAEADKWRYPGDYNNYIKDAAKAASSKPMRQALMASLDRRVWAKTLEEADKWRYPGDYDNYVFDAIEAGTTKSARKLMLRHLNEGRRRASNEYSFDGEDAARAAREQAQRMREETRAREERARQQHQEPPRQEAPRREAPRANERDPELEAIIAKVASDRQFAWVARADRSDIKRVVTTVRSLREKAAEKGETISDRDIYLKYRRAVDKPEGEVSAQTLASYKILEAMMGGSIKGTLPF